MQKNIRELLYPLFKNDILLQKQSTWNAFLQFHVPCFFIRTTQGTEPDQ